MLFLLAKFRLLKSRGKCGWTNLLLMLVRYILGHCLTPVRAVLGEVLMHAKSIGSYNIEDGDSINSKVYVSRQRKPVIYLYSPSDIDVSVKLSLVPEWSLSVVYPAVTTEDHGQRLKWNVRTHQDGKYIALRFVPRAAYERAASLSISPQPNVVTRVCMLFKGICKEHLVNWANAQMQAEKDVAWWV
ncbi:hypothetical protein F4604DRAFT_833616 [Suillus subluteus]|nr:hypothetical protein F4604DRAFT_833616 [Suillus subluteus]